MAVSQPVWPTISVAKLRLACRLLTAKGRSSEGAFLAEGPQAVREALAFGDVAGVIVSESATGQSRSLAKTAADGRRPVFLATDDQLATVTDTVHGQGIVAICRRPTPALGDLTGGLLLLLDQVRDPGNVGTLIRTADAFGARGVIATAGTAEVFAPKVVRASVGSVFHLPVVTGVAFEDAVAWARARGYRLLGADAAGVSLDGAGHQLESPTVWVVGNEAHGLPKDHTGRLDEIIAVPMWGRAESLNVATAAAICLYESALCQSRPQSATP